MKEPYWHFSVESSEAILKRLHTTKRPVLVIRVDEDNKLWANVEPEHPSEDAERLPDVDDSFPCPPICRD